MVRSYRARIVRGTGLLRYLAQTGTNGNVRRGGPLSWRCISPSATGIGSAGLWSTRQIVTAILRSCNESSSHSTCRDFVLPVRDPDDSIRFQPDELAVFVVRMIRQQHCSRERTKCRMIWQYVHLYEQKHAPPPVFPESIIGQHPDQRQPENTVSHNPGRLGRSRIFSISNSKTESCRDGICQNRGWNFSYGHADFCLR